MRHYPQAWVEDFIQDSTAHDAVQRAMGKFGVATRVRAVVRAMAEGEIFLHDVVQ